MEALLMPLEVVQQPGTSRVDYFVLASDGTNPHVPHWYGPGSGPFGPGSWKSLGGDGPVLRGYWAENNTLLVLHLVGNDGVIYSNILDASSSTWSGWKGPNPDTSLAAIRVALS